MLKLQKRGENGMSQRSKGGGGEREEKVFFPPSLCPPFPSFSLTPTLMVTIFTLHNLPQSTSKMVVSTVRT